MRYSSATAIGKGYLTGLVLLTEIIVGLLVIVNWVPPVLVVLVPIAINIFLFPASLNIPNISPAIWLALLNGYLIYKNWGTYKPLFR